MPQQPNELGPFSEYLTNPLKPSTPQATGFEGTGANIAFIASKFLDGVKQHRAEQFAREQAEEEKGRRGYEMAMDAIAKNPTLTPMKRQELMAPLLKGIIGQAGSVKESGKHTGNPLTDVMKNIFTNITGGGQLPKGQKFDMALVGNQLMEMQNEQNHIPYHLSVGDQGVAKLISSMGDNATQEKLLNSEEFRNLVNQTRQNTGIADWAPSIAHLPKDEADRQARITALNEAKAKSAIFGSMLADTQGQSATPSAPQPAPGAGTQQTQPPPTQAVQPTRDATPTGVEQPVATPPVSGSRPIDVIRKVASGEYSKNKLVLGYQPKVVVGAPKTYVDQLGNVFQGHNVESSSDKYKSGIYRDDESGALIPGAREAKTSDTNTTISRTMATLGEHLVGSKLADGTELVEDGNGHPLDPKQLYQSAVRNGRVVAVYPIDPNLRAVNVRNKDNSVEIYTLNPRSGVMEPTGKAPVVNTGTVRQIGEDPNNPGVQVTVTTPNNPQPPSVPPTTVTPGLTPKPAGTAPVVQPGTVPAPATTTPPRGATPPVTPAKKPGLVPLSKPLKEAAKKQLISISNTEDIVNDLEKLLSQKNPATGRPYSQEGGFDAALKQRFSQALYDHGIYPGSWEEAVLQLSNLASVQGSLSYMSGQSAEAMRQDIKQHLSLPTDTPMLMLSKIRNLKKILPRAKAAVEGAESELVRPGSGVVGGGGGSTSSTPSAPGFGPNPFAGKKPKPVDH